MGFRASAIPGLVAVDPWRRPEAYPPILPTLQHTTQPHDGRLRVIWRSSVPPVTYVQVRKDSLQLQVPHRLDLAYSYSDK